MTTKVKTFRVPAGEVGDDAVNAWLSVQGDRLNIIQTISAPSGNENLITIVYEIYENPFSMLI